jgi:hypothetical protein
VNGLKYNMPTSFYIQSGCSGLRRAFSASLKQSLHLIETVCEPLALIANFAEVISKR